MGYQGNGKGYGSKHTPKSSESKRTIHVCALKIIFSYIDGLMQERRNSSALAMELRLSCVNPLICGS